MSKDIDQILGELLGVTGTTTLWDSDEPQEVTDSDYIFGCDVLGAVAKPSKKTRVTTGTSPVLRKKYSRVEVAKPRLGAVAQSVKQAQIVAERTIALGQKLQKAAKMPAFADLSKFGGKGGTPLRAAGTVADTARKATTLKTAQRGLKAGTHMLGALPPKKGVRQIVVTAAQKMTPTDLLRLGLRTEALGKKLLADANKKAAVFRTDRGKLKARVLRTKRGVKAQVLGSSDYYTEIVGDLSTGQSVTDAYGNVIPQDQPVQLTAADIGTKGPDPATLGLPPPPTLDDVRKQRLSESMSDPGSQSDQSVYSSTLADGSSVPLPDGAVYLNTDQQPFPRDYFDVGSWSFFFGGAGVGIYFTPPISYSPSGWGGSKSEPAAYRREYGNVNMPVVALADGVDLGALSNTSVQAGWGPLVGRPSKWNPPAAVPSARAWADGLRLDVATGQFFWFRDHAPTWATLPQDQIDLQQATLDWNTTYTQAVADLAAQQTADQSYPPAMGDTANSDMTSTDPYWQQQFDQPLPTDWYPPSSGAYPLDGGQSAYPYDQQQPLATQPYYTSQQQYPYPQYLPPAPQYEYAPEGYGDTPEGYASEEGYAPEEAAPENQGYGPDQGVDWGDQGGGDEFTPEELQQYEEAGAPARQLDQEG